MKTMTIIMLIIKIIIIIIGLRMARQILGWITRVIGITMIEAVEIFKKTKHRERNEIWFNPHPFYKLSTINIGMYFLNNISIITKNKFFFYMIYIYIYIYIGRIWHKFNFLSWVLQILNQFSFSSTGCHTRLKSLVNPTIYPYLVGMFHLIWFSFMAYQPL